MGPQHSQSLEAWFMHIPGLKIAIPSNAADAYGLMRTALLDRNPVLFIENVRLYGRRSEVELDAAPIPFGSARDRPRGHRRDRRRALGHGRRGRRRSRHARRAGDLRRGDRPADARAARPGDDPRLRTQDPARRGRPRRAQDRAASAPSSRRGSWRRRSTTSTRRSSASPRSTSRSRARRAASPRCTRRPTTWSPRSSGCCA